MSSAHEMTRPEPRVGEPLHSLVVGQILDGVRASDNMFTRDVCEKDSIRICFGHGAMLAYVADRDLVQRHLGLGSVHLSIPLTPEITQIFSEKTFNDVGRLEIHAHGGVYAKYQGIIGSQLLLRLTPDQLNDLEEVLVQKLKSQFCEFFDVAKLPVERG